MSTVRVGIEVTKNHEYQPPERIPERNTVVITSVNTGLEVNIELNIHLKIHKWSDFESPNLNIVVTIQQNACFKDVLSTTIVKTPNLLCVLAMPW